MIEKIETIGLRCGTGLKNFSYTAALVLALLSPQKLVAGEICGGYQGTNVTEVTDSSGDVDTANVIDFVSAREKIGRDLYITKFDVLQDKSELDVHSLIEEFKNESFQYLDSLTNEEKQDYIMKILKENEEIQSVISSMLNDETVIKAIESGDKYSIREKFLDIMDHKKKYELLGGFYTILCWFATVLGWAGLKHVFKSVFKSDKIVELLELLFG